MRDFEDLGISGGIIEIEIVAEKIYYTIIGKYLEMNNLLKNLRTIDNKKKYFISKLIIPVANISDGLELADNIEHVQCSIICDCSKTEERAMFCLLCIEEINGKNILKFPEIILHDNIEPDKIIMGDIGKLIKIIPDQVKESLRLIDVTGPESDILVYCARLSYPKKRINKLK
jgi:hypothetical protein